MSATLTLPAPAKLNLFLHITGRRDDGYHLLQTAFQLLDYGDRLTLRRRADGQLRLHGTLPGVPAEDNLVLRAARRLQQCAPPGAGADLWLTKRLPAGGGLGGGSSNAASTLLGLNRLWQLDLDLATLARLGLELGADVPVFVHGRSAWAEGIGEQLHPIELPARWYLVVIPPCRIATAEVFRQEGLTRSSPELKMRASLDRVIDSSLRNDCQEVVCQLYPEVGEALAWLEDYGPARLTGTGACVFASFDGEHEAENVLQLLPVEWRGFVARGVSISPVHRALEAQP